MTGYPPDAVVATVPPVYEWFRRYMDGDKFPVANRGGLWRIVSHEYLPYGNEIKARIILRPEAAK